MEADAVAREGVAVDFAVEEGGVGSGGDDGDGGVEVGEEPRHVNHGDDVARAHEWKENYVELFIFGEHDAQKLRGIREKKTKKKRRRLLGITVDDYC